MPFLLACIRSSLSRKYPADVCSSLPFEETSLTREDKKKKKKKKAAPKSTLSFALDDEEGGGDDAEVIPGPTKKRKDADAESGDVGASASNGNDENATG